MLDFKGHIDEGKQLPAAFFPFKIKKKKILFFTLKVFFLKNNQSNTNNFLTPENTFPLVYSTFITQLS